MRSPQSSYGGSAGSQHRMLPPLQYEPGQSRSDAQGPASMRASPPPSIEPGPPSAPPPFAGPPARTSPPRISVSAEELWMITRMAVSSAAAASEGERERRDEDAGAERAARAISGAAAAAARAGRDVGPAVRVDREVRVHLAAGVE